jgi:hypothetical protein
MDTAKYFHTDFLSLFLKYIANGLQTFGINRLNLIFKKISTLYWNDQ